jgi:hypothetical protein
MTNKLTMNHRIVLAQRPQPSATLASFRLEHAPQAFLGLLEGANFGKLVVSLDDALGVTA